MSLKNPIDLMQDRRQWLKTSATMLGVALVPASAVTAGEAQQFAKSIAPPPHPHGETVEKTEDFAGAFERCEASGKPGLIEIRIDPEALTPKMSLTQIRQQAIAQGK